MPLERATKFMAAGIEDAELVKLEGQGWGIKAVSSHQLSLCQPDVSIYHEEISGPVLTIKTFRAEESAVEMANDTESSLATSVYTRDLALAMRVAKKLEVGNVSIKSSLGIDVNNPFGGKKGCGIGKEVWVKRVSGGQGNKDQVGGIQVEC
jgi:aldehyde dehydrogenase (NAD+)